MPRNYININPKVLTWARKRSRRTIEELARNVGTTPEIVNSWEAGKSLPTMRQLFKIVERVNQPVQVFFMDEVPVEEETLTQMRRLPGLEFGEESPELAKAVHECIERREVALKLLAELDEKPPNLGINVKVNEDTEVVGIRVRRRLAVEFNKQFLWNDPYSALRNWRSAFERIGVLVFNVKGISKDEMSGFSVTRLPLPIIGINSKDWPNRRIFTMFHELTHILLGQSSILNCPDEWYLEKSTDKIERFCDRVAGSILVPRDVLNHEIKKLGKYRDKSWCDDEVGLLANKFSISRSALIRRLRWLSLISDKCFEDLKSKYQGMPPEHNEGGNPYRNMVSWFGTLLPALAFRAYSLEKVTSSDLSAIFNTQVKYLSKFEQTFLETMSTGLSSI